MLPLVLEQSITHASVIRISPNGKLLAVSQPQFDIVRIFDRVDSTWIQRGRILEGDRDSEFGSTISLWTLPSEVASRRFGRLPLLLAVGYTDRTNKDHTVRVIAWRSNANDWQHLQDSVVCSTAECTILKLDVAFDVETSEVRVVVQSEVNATKECCVYGFNSNELEQTSKGCISNCSQFAITGNARTMAVVPIDVSRYVFFSLERGNLTNSILQQTGVSSFIEKEAFVAFGLSYAGEKATAIFELGNVTIIRSLVVNPNSGFVQAESQIFRHFENITNVIRSLVVNPNSGFVQGESQIFRHFENITNVIVGSNAKTIAIYSHVPGMTDMAQLSVFAYRLLPDTRWQFQEAGNVIDVSGIGSSDISESGPTFVVNRLSAIHAYAPPTCGTNETWFRLSISLDQVPSGYRWEFQSICQYGETTTLTHKVYKACHNCYVPDDVYLRTRITEDTCIPSVDDGCYRLTLLSEHGFGDGSGFVLFKDGVVVGQSNSSVANSDDEVHIMADSEVVVEQCQVDSELLTECEEGESKITVSFLYDNFANEVSWDLRKSGGGLIYEKQKANRTNGVDIDEVCIAKDDEECVVFSVYDSYGDGICCSFGYGGIQILLDGEMIVEDRGDYDFQKRIIIKKGCFGVCVELPTYSYLDKIESSSASSEALPSDDTLGGVGEEEVSWTELSIAGCNLTLRSCSLEEELFVLSIPLDDFPEETTWILRDGSTGTSLAAPGFLSNTTITSNPKVYYRVLDPSGKSSNGCNLTLRSCSLEEELFVLSIPLDDFPEETTWILRDGSTGTTLAAPGFLSNTTITSNPKVYSQSVAHQTVLHQKCVSVEGMMSECSVFVTMYIRARVVAVNETGYSISWNGSNVETYGRRSRIGEMRVFGDGCSNDPIPATTEILFDAYPSEIGFTIFDRFNNTVYFVDTQSFSSDYFGKLERFIVYLLPREVYYVQAIDSYGDGWYCQHIGYLRIYDGSPSSLSMGGDPTAEIKGDFHINNITMNNNTLSEMIAFSVGSP
eukprot:CAMPEP_0202474920 /NCGR_PEP_ID=MMETSP1360-20130828/92632_1 /ASSEMBLY_ACC=CAM_ASM_000848 /TAXON_ID=515479 /ORGANISM="Licmophora paradoxa, Strain CCMP2313" /LENGTH=1010 /DNA_ID=CAMNT_0049102065 /DNA_START=1106 /DNA_END=4139 /DNA_ORIENTATION=-